MESTLNISSKRQGAEDYCRALLMTFFLQTESLQPCFVDDFFLANRVSATVLNMTISLQTESLQPRFVDDFFLANRVPATVLNMTFFLQTESLQPC